MADETLASIANLIREQRGPLVEALRWSTVLMSEIERDSDPESFDGSAVRIPVVLSPHQGAGMTTESGTLNTSRQIASGKVLVDTGIAHITVSWTTKAVAAAKGGQNSWIDLIPGKMKMAEDGMRRIINEQFCGAGDALLAAITAGHSSSTTVEVGTNANFYQLYAERIVDILNRSDGATVSLGRTIVDFDEDAGTLTVDTAVTTTTSHGLYIEGSYGNAIAGVGQAAGATGTFQTFSKDDNPAWRGVSIDGGGAPLSQALLDSAERRAGSRSGKTPDFYIGDPAVIDKYGQGLTVQSRWAGDNGKLATGWTGILFRDKTLVREYDVAPQTLFGLVKEDMKVYTRDAGPDWDEVDGMFKRFSRALPYESWLVWQLQLGFTACNGIVEVSDLQRAS